MAEVSIAEITEEGFRPLPDNFAKFHNWLTDFSIFVTQTIKSPVKLAEMMAGKARLLENILEEAVQEDIKQGRASELTGQLETFRTMLLHDLEPKQFADLYAQTLAYGLFAARYHDPTLSTFDRTEAAQLIPQSNPLLRNLFQSIAGFNIDERIRPTVDNLAEVFRHADVKSILEGFGKATAQNDPVIHFYETFLAKYDPALRKSRGVWYTPEPVVQFIVRAVDEILKTRFNLKAGLADTSKTTVTLDSQVKDSRTKSGYKQYEKEVHRVQILDPATGTGTFLAEIIKYIYTNHFAANQGIWPSYAENDLIPRLNGFEILMASYAMAHLKIDMLLSETGYTTESVSQRLKVFLTNSLEEYHPDTHNLFAQWLSNEAREANAVKKDAPVMVVLGNPPYSGESANKGDWIMHLMEDYKKEPGGKQKLQEKNSKWINDDYVKFMRFAQHFIEKNSEGILAFINPHGFLDNPTFRGMRWHLLKTYDEIFTIDLHGNTKKKETAPDGSKDENVFDIEQGVSINLLVKTGSKKEGELAKVYHHDLYGKRHNKYEFLRKTSFSEVPYRELSMVEPMYYMVPKDYRLFEEYKLFLPLDSLFTIFGNGVVTKRDRLCIQSTAELAYESAQDILLLEKHEFYTKYRLPKDVRDWKYEWAKRDIEESGPNRNFIQPISYRPFDTQFIYYTGASRGFVGWPVQKVMRNYIDSDNIGLLVPKAFKDGEFNHAFLTKNMSEAIFLSSLSGSNAMNFPLYLYPEDNSPRFPNLNPEMLNGIERKLGIKFCCEGPREGKNYFTAIDLLDYIYAVLHSPSYRDKYKEFLKTDFPRVPYPQPDTFWQLVELGGQLRQLHLMEADSLDTPITSYPAAGDNRVTRKITQTSPGYQATDENHGKVWINDSQYFDNVPLIAWEFYIGGYQPAQKWLKDRKGQTLDFHDISHYQRIIKALVETHSLMQRIDELDVHRFGA